MDLKLDPKVRPEFLTYSAKFDGGGLGNETGAWVCKTSNSFGLTQKEMTKGVILSFSTKKVCFTCSVW